MWNNYFITAIRNIRKNALHSVINISGLAIGMTVCLLILNYVRYEKSYDSFHSKAERIYRLRYERTDKEGATVRFASCCPPAGLAIRQEFPEVEKVARLFQYRASVSVGENAFIEERMFFAEADFFSIFDFKFVDQEGGKDLKEPNRAYISVSTAKKYFGGENPIGRSLSIDKKTDYRIAGIFEDVQRNSHIKFDILLSYPSIYGLYGKDVEESWGDTGWFTYLLFSQGADIAAFDRKAADKIEAEVNKFWKEYGIQLDLVTQPLKDIHLSSHFMQEYEPNGDRDVVQFLSIIAVVVIIIAWVNYINLSTARSLTRAKEVGLRKVAGASRFQLIIQFLGETVLINLFAVLLSMGMLALILPFFEILTGSPADQSLWISRWFWQTVMIMLGSGVVLSGFYPVMVLSSFRPLEVLRGKIGNAPGSFNFRKILVVVQFGIALGLMTVTAAVFKQISFMKQKDLGFSIEKKLIMRAPRVRAANFAGAVSSFKNDLLQNSSFEKFCIVTEVPGKQLLWDAGDIHKLGENQKGKNYQIVGADYDFADLFKLKFISGRNFSKKFGTDSTAIVMNETGVRWMGFTHPDSSIGQRVSYWNEVYTIIGVVKDYHQQSAKQAFEPTIFRLMPYGRGVRANFVAGIASGDEKRALDDAAALYRRHFPDNPFEYFFLDEYYSRQYKPEFLFGNVFASFSFLALFITSLGTWGLTLFMIGQRTKEIGIRKILGARTSALAAHLTKELFLLVAVAFIFILPVSYIGIRRWLETFSTRIDVTADLFLLPLLIVISVISITISVSVYKAVTADPVKSLRYE